jgi:DNA-binding response OmpR family regulator
VSVVLAVDDDPDVLALLEVTLRQGGHDVRAAGSADQALSLLSSSVVDVILLDVMMPGRDGWSLLEQLKEDDRLAEIPVIMVTARGEPEDKLRGGVGGALRYVTKPFLPEQLLEAVREASSADEPEPTRRRVVQRTSLSELARREAGREVAKARPHLSALSFVGEAGPSAAETAATHLSTLTRKQRELLAELGRGRSVAQVATERDVSRSNVYASIRRIHRKLGTRTVSDLALVARESGLV